MDIADKISALHKHFNQLNIDNCVKLMKSDAVHKQFEKLGFTFLQFFC